jgi:FkbM family methyltransferase
MNRRMAVLLHWLRGRRNGVGSAELLRFLKAPPARVRARRLIEAVDEDAGIYRVHLVGLEQPLIWPKSVDLSWLYVVLAEQGDPSDWHFYEVPETSVRSDDVVVDCGAAEGLFALLVAKRAKRVYAVEPLPLWVQCMRQTFQRTENVQILSCALSDQTGRLRLQGRALSSKLNRDGDVEVHVETVDNLFFNRGIEVSYLKADLEGHDLKMLRGARHTIANYTPRIAVTTYHDPAHARLMIDFVRSLNGRYRFKTKGIETASGAPVMLHAWVDS